MIEIVDTNSPIFGKTITMEFYIDVEKVLHVIYNMINYSFPRFWKEIENSDEICRVIYNQLYRQFPLHLKQHQADSRDWRETFIKFINAHLGEYDRIMDVVIRSNGSVSITLEA